MEGQISLVAALDGEVDALRRSGAGEPADHFFYDMKRFALAGFFTSEVGLRSLGYPIVPGGVEAWQLLHEALPTALGQGVAGQRFKAADWDIGHRWYHTEAVDRYAKQIYPLVRDTLAAGGTFDEGFLDAAVALYSGGEAQVTPRSP